MKTVFTGLSTVTGSLFLQRCCCDGYLVNSGPLNLKLFACLDTTKSKQLISLINSFPFRQEKLHFFSLSSLCFVLLLSCWVALQCLCAPVCSGRGLSRLWMALCLSKLSPRLPQSSAIPRPLRPLSLCLCLITTSAIWLQYVPTGPNPSCYTHIVQFCVLARQEPCETYYLCI